LLTSATWIDAFFFVFFVSRQNLDLNKELNDKVAEGRTLGNLGNVNYLLQDYSTSIEDLEKVG